LSLSGEDKVRNLRWGSKKAKPNGLKGMRFTWIAWFWSAIENLILEFDDLGFGSE
jgi:hypothetical protein